MGHYFFQRVRRILITFRFSILSIFITLFTSAMLALIFLNFEQSMKTLLFVANKLMNQVSASVRREFNNEIKKAENDSQLSILLIKQNLIDPDKQIDLINYTMDLAYQFSLVQGAYWGDPKGTYIKAEYNVDNTIMTELIDRSTNPPHLQRIYRDDKLNEISRKTLEVPVFDPRTRPWYTEAVKAGHPLWTDIYVYQPSGLLGITRATPIYKNNGELRGVFGLDIGLDWLSWFISLQQISPNAIIFISTPDGKIVAHSKKYNPNKHFQIMNMKDLNTPWIAESFKLYQENHKQTFSFRYDGKDYLATYNPLTQFEMHGWVIGIVTPESDFTSELKRTSLINTFISILILIIGLLLVSAFVTRLVRPINDLVKETDRIRHFKLSGGQPVKTIIKEVMVLSNALFAMKMSLKSFKKYIPASLVRTLIETGQAARIGGIKKPLAVLFSDVVDFTKLAEHMPPNLLMEHMCEYFDELSKIIASHQGTIDKYIGDSIMAFWGAPLEVHSPEKLAAETALECERRLTILNEKWKNDNKPLLKTRFGLHFGEAIVGNVGSSERINYTALGDTINMASRLEGVNKLYGTKILISSALYEKIKDFFVTRKVDVIAVKGKTTAGAIYELLAQHVSELDFNVKDYSEQFDKAFNAYSKANWDEAILLFKGCLEIYPADTVAPVFIKRCENFKLNPPDQWDGVWRIQG